MKLDLPSKEDSSSSNSSSTREESALAEALGDKSKHSLVYFYSSKCLLCRSVTPAIDQERERCSNWLDFATVCTDDQTKWAPEMLNYQIESVPCFVLLDKQGNAIAKSGRPRNRSHLASSLKALLSLAAPAKQQQQ